MRTYVDVTFSSDGTVATVVAERLRDLAGVTLLTGEHDIAFDWTTVEGFRERIRAIHEALAGTHATYRVMTQEADDTGTPWVAWPPPLQDTPVENPGYKSRRPSP
jgi:hypothetical protein